MFFEVFHWNFHTWITWSTGRKLRLFFSSTEEELDSLSMESTSPPKGTLPEQVPTSGSYSGTSSIFSFTSKRRRHPTPRLLLARRGHRVHVTAVVLHGTKHGSCIHVESISHFRRNPAQVCPAMLSCVIGWAGRRSMQSHPDGRTMGSQKKGLRLKGHKVPKTTVL